MSERLCVVMPVYNERASIGPVLRKWHTALTGLKIDFVIRPYNDGSKDDSLSVMRAVAQDLDNIDVKDKANGGHGHTILTGYRQAVADGFDWVFQVDSDDEMGPEKFAECWNRRGDYDFLVGYRDGRLQAFTRKAISFVSRFVVRLSFGKSIWDVNSPYRLMRVSYFKSAYFQIPDGAFAPNVILSGIAANDDCRRFEFSVPQHDRVTGVVSIKKWKLLKAVITSFVQTISFGWKYASALRRFCVVGFVVLCALALVSVVQGFLNGLRLVDFQWLPSRLLLQGENPYLYSLRSIKFCGSQVDANQVPSCLALLFPFAALPRFLGNALWDGCNLVFTAGVLFFSFRLWFSREARCIDDSLFVPFVALFLAGTPWCNLIGQGQHLMFSLCFFLAALYACEKKKPLLGGGLLALSAFKYTTIAPMAFVFFWRREWTAIAVAMLIHVVLTVACGAYLGESPFRLVGQSLEVGNRLLLGCGTADIASVVLACGGTRDQASIAAVIGYLVCVALCCSALVGKKSQLFRVAFLAVVSNMMFYHRGYDFVTLAFPLMYVLSSDTMGRVDWRARLLRTTVWGGVVHVFFVAKLLDVLHLSGAWSIVACFSWHVLVILAFLVFSFSPQSHNKPVLE